MPNLLGGLPRPRIGEKYPSLRMDWRLDPVGSKKPTFP